MHDFFIKVGKEKVTIDKRVFLVLLELSPIKQYRAYVDAVSDSDITFANLKMLAEKADVPYPLFFASKDKVDLHLKDKDLNLFQKLPSKNEIRLASRGAMKVEDIELIVRDIARKQEFLKNRVLPSSAENTFIGSVAKKVKQKVSNEKIAEQIRDYLEIDLASIRKLPKDRVLDYLRKRAENKDIFISFSSYNYMPQNIDREVGLSGVCIKDKKFPYVFINTRDGDEQPKILESSGRQIFTLVAMLVCIAMNKFVLSTKKGKSGETEYKQVFSIVGEILIPRKDLITIKISTLEELKQHSQFFKVTPSMLLARLLELKHIAPKLAAAFRKELASEIKGATGNHPRQPLQTTGYGKYNGDRFSREVVRAHKAGKVSFDEVKNVLFRKGKMDLSLFQEYSNVFK